MTKRPILTILFASVAFVTSLTASVATNQHLQVSLFNKEVTPLLGMAYDQVIRIDPEAYSYDQESDETSLDDNIFLGKYGEWTWCEYELPEEPEYQVKLLSTTITEDIQPGDAFAVDMIFENTGNVRLYPEDSGCYGQTVLNVGTQNEQDRGSLFGGSTNGLWGWTGDDGNRIKMVDEYAEPGDDFMISFQSIMPEDSGDNIYREFFQAVAEGQGWLDETFILDFVVGEPSEEDYDNISFVTNQALDAASLRGSVRSVWIDLSTQYLYAYMDDTPIWKMQISSGNWDTPTPVGDYTIFQKQELRIAGSSPHYNMPYWQYWDSRGYGIHGLPYLTSDGGTFWTEAAEHLGIPVSHGCVRVGDDDVVKLYEYTSIGTELYIRSSLDIN